MKKIFMLYKAYLKTIILTNIFLFLLYSKN
jgi:hypothetical protein